MTTTNIDKLADELGNAFVNSTSTQPVQAGAPALPVYAGTSYLTPQPAPVTNMPSSPPGQDLSCPSWWVEYSSSNCEAKPTHLVDPLLFRNCVAKLGSFSEDQIAALVTLAAAASNKGGAFVSPSEAGANIKASFRAHVSSGAVLNSVWGRGQ